MIDPSLADKDHPYGQVKRCICQSETEPDVANIEDGLLPEERILTFRQLTPDESIGPAIKTITAASQQHAGLFYLYGHSGIGKTHLLMAAVNHTNHNHGRAYYAKTLTLLDELRQSFADETYHQRWEKLLAYDTLCIDELERFNGTEFAINAVFNLIDERYRRRATKLTLLASNLDPSRLPAPIQDRCRRNTIHIIGPSWRS